MISNKSSKSILVLALLYGCSQLNTAYADSKNTLTTVTSNLSLSQSDIILTAASISQENLVAVQKLYIGLYGRPADQSGLNFWAGKIQSGEFNASQVAQQFSNSTEFKNIYNGKNSQQVVDRLYQNLFNRAPDANGRQFWSNALSSGQVNIYQMADLMTRNISGSDKANFDKKINAALVNNNGNQPTPPVVTPPTPPVVTPPTPPVVTPPTPPVVTPPTSPVTPGKARVDRATGLIKGTTNIPLGVVGHDNNQDYYPKDMEARVRILAERNLLSYRSGEFILNNIPEMDRLVSYARKYGVVLRPVITSRMNQQQAYTIAKRYANDIKIWEIGNEQDYSKQGAQERINQLIPIYRGIKQASDELGANLKTTINVMSCNSDDRTANARCAGDRNGAMWFIDMAKRSGFDFDYISFHYYPHFQDKGYWMDMYLGQMRAMAKKYNTKIFYNEMNCANVYSGTTNGGNPGDNACYDSVKQMLTILNNNYKDIVMEINMYELLDEPSHIVNHEKHFGMMYNINKPKPVFDLVTSFAK